MNETAAPVSGLPCAPMSCGDRSDRSKRKKEAHCLKNYTGMHVISWTIYRHAYDPLDHIYTRAQPRFEPLPKSWGSESGEARIEGGARDGKREGFGYS